MSLSQRKDWSLSISSPRKVECQTDTQKEWPAPSGVGGEQKFPETNVTPGVMLRMPALQPRNHAEWPGGQPAQIASTPAHSNPAAWSLEEHNGTFIQGTLETERWK